MGAVLLGGCSLTTTDRASCVRDEQCRAEFGLGSVCMDDGFCDYVAPNPRCTRAYPEHLFDHPIEHRDALIIGNLMDRSLATHQARENAVELAMSQANAQGGILGRELSVIFCTIEENTDLDGLSRREAAITSARYLVDVIGVPAIIGPASSGDVQAVFESIRDDDVLLISPSATSPALSSLEAPPFTDEQPGLLWRTAPPDSLQGQAIASDMMTPGPGRLGPVTAVAVVHEQGAYGDGLTEVFEQAFDGAVTRLAYQDPSVLGELVAMAGALDVQEVVFVSSQISDVIAFLNAASLSSYDDKTIFLTDGAANSDVLVQADPVRFAQVRGSRPAPLDAESDFVYMSFLASYLAAYNDDATRYSFVAHAYDAAWMVAYGAAWAVARGEPLGGRSIAMGLRRLSDPLAEEVEIKPSTWYTVVDALSAGRSVDITGASGPLDYDADTEETSSDIQLWEIRDGQIVGIDLWSPN